MLDKLQKALALQQELQVFVWDPNNDKVEISFPSHIMEISDLSFEIAGPIALKHKVAPLLTVGTVICVLLEINPTPLMFYPVISALPNTADSGYWLKIPNDVQVEETQRRKHVRVPMIIPFQLEYLMPNGKWLSIDARTRNLSGGGMSFTCIRLFPKGQLLKVRIELSSSKIPLFLSANVITSQQNTMRRQPDDLYTTSCQFKDLDQAHETLLMRECFYRELGIKQ